LRVGVVRIVQAGGRMRQREMDKQKVARNIVRQYRFRAKAACVNVNGNAVPTGRLSAVNGVRLSPARGAMRVQHSPGIVWKST
jgi:sulfur carrier protein ThiS